MKVCPLTRIFSPGPAISPNVLLTRDVFYMERVFLYCHGPTEYTVILVGSILQVLQGFMVSLECESHASQIQLETSITPQYCGHFFSMIVRWAQRLDGVAYWVQLSFIPLQQCSCCSNSRCICPLNEQFHQLRMFQYWFL